jgi:anti-anti-sigma factor
MNVKIDTKEKFTVITPEEQDLPANMTEELREMMLLYLKKDIPHIILNMHNVETVDEKMIEMISGIGRQFNTANASFVICNLNINVQKRLDEIGMLDMLNHTPTESEAWDIVQMEEIERELLSDTD